MWFPFDGRWPSVPPGGCFAFAIVTPEWDGIGEYPKYGGRSIAKFVEDRLGLWGAEVGLDRVEVWNELTRQLPGLALEPRYVDWESLIPTVQRAFHPRVQAHVAQTLWRRTAEEYGLHDPYVLEFILATIATVSMPGDPLWGFVVGAPSALKTELLRWQAGPKVFTLSRLTAHSLISGLKGGLSLLPLLDGRCLIIKDFTTVLEMDRKARDEVFAQLRDSFDGYYEGHFGSVGTLSFRAHYHVLAAVTSAIEEYYSVQSSLGQRFLKVRVPPLDAFERALAHGGREEVLRSEFSDLASKVLEGIGPDEWKSVSFTGVQALKPIVELLARGRTHVSRRDGQISMVPEPEMVPRLAKQLRKLAIGRALVYGRSYVDASDLGFLQRVAVDTLPVNRGLILRSLGVPRTIEQVSIVVRLPTSTVYRHVEDLEALDLISGDGGKPAVFCRIGPALVLDTPHFSEKTVRTLILREVGGDPARRPAEPGSWTEPAIAKGSRI